MARRRGFRSFVILGVMRSGSNYLEASLNSAPGVKSLGELFNPYFIGQKDRQAFRKITKAMRDEDPLMLWRRVQRRARGLPGFRFFHDHDPRILADVLADKTCAKIILTREVLPRYLSLLLARASGQWRLSDPAHRRPEKARFDLAEFQAYAAETGAFYAGLRRALQESGQVGFWLDYTELSDLAVLNGLLTWLGLPETARLSAPAQSLVRQNPGAWEALVENPAEMAKALAGAGLLHLWPDVPKGLLG